MNSQKIADLLHSGFHTQATARKPAPPKRDSLYHRLLVQRVECERAELLQHQLRIDLADQTRIVEQKNQHLRELEEQYNKQFSSQIVPDESNAVPPLFIAGRP